MSDNLRVLCALFAAMFVGVLVSTTGTPAVRGAGAATAVLCLCAALWPRQ